MGALLLALAPAAHAAVETKTVTFDDLAAPTRVTNQYESQGIIFAAPTEYGFDEQARACISGGSRAM